MRTASRRSRQALSDQVLYEIIQQVRPLFRALLSTVEHDLEGTGVTVATRAVLERLLDHGPQTVPQIGRSLSLGRQFIQRLVNAALASELVKLADNPAHQRSSLVSLTDKGRQTIVRIRKREQTVLRRIAKGMERSDLETALGVIATLTREMSALAKQVRS